MDHTQIPDKFSSLKITLEDSQKVSQIGRALSSPERVKILQYLCSSPAIISKIAKYCNLPLSTAAHHVRVLEEAGLITVCNIPASRGSQKTCLLMLSSIEFSFYSNVQTEGDSLLFQQSMPIGNYFDYKVSPPCGMISDGVRLAPTDETSGFCMPNRINAQLIWMNTGYLEYHFSNSIFTENEISRAVFSLELCSEFPGNRMDWPSDITVWINGHSIGTIHSPSDYGDRHGILTPQWWGDINTQHGDLYWIVVTENGCYINEKQTSSENLKSLNLSDNDSIRLRVGIDTDAEHCGGMNLFGYQFGDYPQDIVFTVYGKKAKGMNSSDAHPSSNV